MLVSEFLQEYWLHDSLITGWSWAEPNLLVLELEVNMNQDDTDEDDIRPIILIFEGCTLIDELNEGFNGFSSGHASIFDATEVKESTSPTARQGIRLFMQYDNYDGTDRKWLEVVIFTDKFSVIDPKRPS